MKILPAFSPLLLSSLFLLSSCLEKPEQTPEQTVEPTEEIESEQDSDTVILKDPSGATLSVDCGGLRLKAFLSAGTTTDFAVPVRIRFQGGDADARFRKKTEMGPDEEDYWDFDEETGLFEVSSTIYFLEALGTADRLFLEVKLSDQERRALVFEISEEQQSILLSSLKENEIRVDNEMRALGLGKYAPQEDTKPEPPDHLKVDVEEEALYALYDEYILTTSKMTSQVILPTPTPEDNHAMKAMSDPIRPISSAIKYYVNAYPDAIATAERLALDSGFESLEQWMSIGDRVQVGMIVINLDQKSPGHIDQARAFSEEEMSSFDSDRREYIEIVKAFSEMELEWFAENRPRFLRAIGN